MKMTKQRYSIATNEGTRREVDGYAFEIHGIRFGVDRRSRPNDSTYWICSELESGRTVGAGTGKSRKQAIELLQERFEQMTRRQTLEEALKRIRDAVKTCGPVDELPLEKGGEA